MTTYLAAPIVLDSARVVLFAETGGQASHTGRGIVIVGEKLLGPLPGWRSAKIWLELTFFSCIVMLHGKCWLQVFVVPSRKLNSSPRSLIQVSLRQRDSTTRESKLVVRGTSIEGIEAEAVVKLTTSGSLFVITVYLL